MKLSNFEEYVEGVIVKRGKNYFQQGYVGDIDEIVKNQFIVEVEGSECYTVEINLTHPDMFVESYCNCPYDWGEHCKHQVAALFALRRDMELKTFDKKTDLITLVSNLTKEELIAFVLNLAKIHPEIRRRLMSANFPQDDNQTVKDI